MEIYRDIFVCDRMCSTAHGVNYSYGGSLDHAERN